MGGRRTYQSAPVWFSANELLLDPSEPTCRCRGVDHETHESTATTTKPGSVDQQGNHGRGGDATVSVCRCDGWISVRGLHGDKVPGRPDAGRQMDGTSAA